MYMCTQREITIKTPVYTSCKVVHVRARQDISPRAMWMSIFLAETGTHNWPGFGDKKIRFGSGLHRLRSNNYLLVLAHPA